MANAFYQPHYRHQFVPVMYQCVDYDPGRHLLFRPWNSNLSQPWWSCWWRFGISL